MSIEERRRGGSHRKSAKRAGQILEEMEADWEGIQEQIKS